MCRYPTPISPKRPPKDALRTEGGNRERLASSSRVSTRHVVENVAVRVLEEQGGGRGGRTRGPGGGVEGQVVEHVDDLAPVDGVLRSVRAVGEPAHDVVGLGPVEGRSVEGTARDVGEPVGG